MARTTKQLSGGAKDKFLRAVAHAATGVPAAAADRIGDLLAEHVTEVRVRREAWESLSKGDAAGRGRPSGSPDADAPPAFDPFQFSAVSVFTRHGHAALADRLAALGSVERLRQLAEAQHLVIDGSIDQPSALCAAIVAATERRIAERRAAAG